MRLSFLYWNTANKASKVDVLKNVLKETPKDIVILRECREPLSQIFCDEHNLTELKLYSAEREILQQRLYYEKSLAISLSHLNNYSEDEVEEITISQTIFGQLISREMRRISRVSLVEVKFNQIAFLLAIVHLPSKKNLDEISQLQTASNYKRVILERSSEYENQVVVVGDFNMNPFDAGMVEPQGFFAINYKKKVQEKTVFQHSTEIMFYNPSWNLLGDYDKLNDTSVVSGSHFYDGALSKKLFWHLFDQVIVSKKMIANFVEKDLDIVQIDEVINEVQTITNRKNATYSDHLPIKFTLNFDK